MRLQHARSLCFLETVTLIPRAATTSPLHQDPVLAARGICFSRKQKQIPRGRIRFEGVLNSYVAAPRDDRIYAVLEQR